MALELKRALPMPISALQALGKALWLDNPVEQRKEKGKHVLSYAEVTLSRAAKRVVVSGCSVHPLALQQIEKGRQFEMIGQTGLQLGVDCC